jgi:GNAT superfamily N-acetyltransferase
MALLFKQGAASQFNLQDFEPSFGQKFGAIVDETLIENPTNIAYKNIELAIDDGPKLSADEASGFLKQYPFRLDIDAPKDGQYSEAQLRTLAEQQRELRKVEDIRERTPWDYGTPIRALGMFGASLVDPINVATAFVPWTRAITAARSLEAARLSSSAGTRFFGRAGLGAIDGGISTAVIEPFYALGRSQLGNDYDAFDSMANIAFGTVLGGGILGVGGVGADAFRRLARREIPSDRFAGLSVDDIQLVQALDVELKAGGMMPSTLRAVLDSYSPEMRRAAGFPEDLPEITVKEPRSTATVVARSDDGLSMTVKNRAGSVTAQMDGTNLRIVSASVRESMQRKGNGTALLERTINEGLDDGMSVVTDATVPTALARTIEALENKGFVVTKNENTINVPESEIAGGAIRSADPDQPVYTIERGEGYQRPQETAQDQIDAMSPETREATFRGGLAQMLSGYGLSVDPIIKTDAAFGATSTAADLKKNADLSLRPENIRAADFEASEEIAFDNQNSQGWDGLSDAEAAVADADTLLDQTIAAGDQAYKYSRGKAPTKQRQEIDSVRQNADLAGGKDVNAADVDQVINDERIPVITLQDLVGKKIFPTIADRTAAGAVFTGIDSSKPQIHIPMLGGPLFPFRLSNLAASVVWANRGKGVTSQKAARLKEGANYMMVVLGDANMHQSNSTVNNAFFATLEAYTRDKRITGKNADKLVNMIRTAGDADPVIATALTKFPGFANSQVLTKYIDGLSFNARRRLLTILGNKEASNLGAPPLQRILDKTREPEFAGNRWGDGVLIVEVDQQSMQVELGMEGTTPHPDFPLGIKGTVVGRLDVPVNYELLWEDWLNQSKLDAISRGTPEDKVNVRRSFELAKPIVEISQDLVNKIGVLRQENIDSPLQARMAADFAAQNWKPSGVPVNKGGISPQAFVDAVQLSPASATLRMFDINSVKQGIKDNTLKLYQLGDAQVYFALETVGDRVNLVALVNNEQGARGFSGAMVAKAIEEGATHVEVHAVKSPEFPNGFLPTLYKSLGFSVVSEKATPKNLYKGTKLKDAVDFWKQYNKDFDIDKDGLPSLVTLEFTNGNRQDATKRYIKNGIAGLIGGRAETDGTAVTDRLLGIDKQVARRAGKTDEGRAVGAEVVSDVRPIASRARDTIQSVAKLNDNELRNLGLTAEDRAIAKDFLRYARGSTDGSDVSFNALYSAIESFGADAPALLEAGQLQIVSKVSDLPSGPHPVDVKAMTAPDGRVFVVAENVSPAEMRGIVLHEVGVHVGMERMLGADVFQSVLKDLDAATMRGETWAQAARDSVPEDTPRSLVREEQLAYLVQNAPETPLAQRIIAAIRAWAFRTFKTARDRMQLTEADFRSLAISGLKFASRQQKQSVGELGTVYARGAVEDTSTAKSELTVADAKVERAKSYAGALRAAADKLENDAQAVDAMRSQMPDITAEEIDELLVGLRTQVKNLRGMSRKAREALVAGDKAAALQPEAMQAADMLANNLQLAAVIERRNAALNLNARLKATSFVNQFREKELDFEGFAALLVGSERVRTGARISVDAEAKAFRGEFVGGLLADMEKAGLNQAFISGRFDRDIYDAMWRMGADTPDMTGLSPEVIKMAEIINKYQNAARNRRNRFGAWIRDLQGYITRQTHDMFKIRAVTQDEWVNVVKDKIDLPKMIRLGIIDEADPIGSLQSMYNDFASGSHMKPMAAEEDIVALGRGSNLAKRESVSRTLYFKDGLAAYDYHAQFGGRRLAEEVLIGLDRSAMSASLLKTLGTNPEATLTRLLDEYEESLKTNPERFDKFRSQRGAIMNLLAQVDGTVFMPGNVTAAKVNAFLRSWTSMAKLGGALISSVSDLAGYAAELRYAQNKNMYSGLADSVGALLKGRAKGERADILGSLGVFYESVSSGVSARFDSPELVSGKMAAAMQAFFRLNGLSWWTEVLRDGAALAHSNYMAMQSSKAFNDINPELRRLLTLYNIDAGKWDLMRMGQLRSADGKMYLTPEALRTLPQESLEGYIRSVGRTVSPAAVQNLIDDLSQTMRIMFIDRAHHAVLEPNARNRAFMLRGTKPGTVPGEILRYIGQFKSFSVAITQSVLGREVYGRGYDTVGEYLRKGRGDMLGLAHMIGLYGLLGYGAMSIKDLIKGREPRDPMSVQTVIASLAQGGGLGLYGDFLFGEYSRFGKSLVSSIAGPVAGAADTVAELYTRVRNGDDVAAVSFKALLDNTPFANLFWLRPLLDYAILFNIQESLNPGYLRRMERRVERQNEQRFLFKPSEVIR